MKKDHTYINRLESALRNLSAIAIMIAAYAFCNIGADAQTCYVYKIDENGEIKTYECDNEGVDPCVSTFVSGTLFICHGELILSEQEPEFDNNPSLNP